MAQSIGSESSCLPGIREAFGRSVSGYAGSRRVAAVAWIAGFALAGLLVSSNPQATLAPRDSSVRGVGSDQRFRARALESYGKLPMSFEANAGQFDDSVRFASRGRGYALFLKADESVLSLRTASRTQTSAPPAVMSMKVLNARTDARITGEQELPGRSNYFIGADARKWRTNIPNYAKVRFAELYPGVDLVYYGNQGKIEYDFVVKPGADPNAITLSFLETGLTPEKSPQKEGQLHVAANGDLLIAEGRHEVRLHKPVIYQEKGDGNGKDPAREFIDGAYRLIADNQVTFQISSYDRSKALVIDPILTYSSYLGGSGNDAATGITVDSAGNAYVVGTTTSPDFPTSGGAYQASLADGACTNVVCGDVFVTKLAPNGSTAVFSTYIGGSGQDVGNAIAIDSTGNSYLTGLTNSPNFPVVNPIQAVYGGGSYDAFVTKLNATGNALVYSTYLGGSGLDQGNGIAVDSSGEAYVVGGTQSANYASPTTVGTCQGNGVFDAFVSKLNSSGNGFVYNTCLGGSGADQAYAVTLSSSTSYAYVVGSTSSTNFPTISRAYQGGLKGSQNAFITVLNGLSSFYYSSYIGGNGVDTATGIALDSSNNAYVTGSTTSSNFPVTAGTYQTSYHGAGDGFLAKFILWQGGAGSLPYSTYFGGSGNDVSLGIRLDAAANAYVTGYTTSQDFPLLNPIQASYAGGGTDAFVLELNRTLSAAIFSTYLGGSGAEDNGQGAIALDAKGNVYVVGMTTSTDFPVVTGTAYQANRTPNSSAFVSKLGVLSPPPPGIALSWPLPTLVNGGIVQESVGEFNLAGNSLYHTGLSLGAAAGTPIAAAAAGNVVMIQLNTPPGNTVCYDHGYGTTVIIQHPLANGQNVYTQYSHMLTVDSTVQSKCGTPDSTGRLICPVPVPVTALQALGTVGHTACGYSDTNISDTHLHFELKNFGTLEAFGNDSGPSAYTPSLPDLWGWFDPMNNLNAVANLATAVPVSVTGGSPVNLLTGPGGISGTAYRTINQVNAGTLLDVVRTVNGATTTPQCNSGWDQVTNIDGSFFVDTSSPGTGRMLAGWVCADFVTPIGPTQPPPPPTLSVSTTSISFNAVQGSGSNPTPANVNVTNTGSGSLTFTASSDSSAWLSVSPSSGTAPQTLQITATLGTLTAGTYTGHITVTAPGALSSPATITVTFNVAAPPPPTLTLSTTSLTFNATQGSGSNPAPANVNVTNTGSGSLSFTASSDSPAWLSVSPGSGTAPQTLQITATLGTLTAGTYTGHITVTAPGAQGSPGTITVTFTVATPPTLSVSTTSIGFNAVQGSGSNPAPANVNVTNTGSGSLSFTAASDSPAWLSVSPGSGTAPQTLQITATLGTLTAGTYTGHITVTAPGALSSPATITVTFNVAAPPPPTLSLSTTSLTFNATQGSGSNPAPANVNVTNTGSGSLSFTAASDSPAWLSVSPGSGTAPQTLQITATLGTLTAGTYTGHITVTAPGVLGSPGTITVTFAVAPPASWAVVQQSQNSASSTTSQTLFPTSPTVGNLLLVHINWFDSTNTVTSVKDTLGNTFVSAGPPSRQSGVQSTQVFYAMNVAAGMDQVTVTLSASTHINVYTYEISGAAASNTLDVAANGNGSGNSVTTGSIVTSTANDFVFVGVGNASAATDAVGSGFTGMLENAYGLGEFQTVATPGTTIQGTSTLASCNCGWTAVVVAFRPAASPTSVQTPLVQTNYQVLSTYYAGNPPTVGASACAPAPCIAQTFLNPNAAGNMIFVWVSWNSGFNLTSLSDSAGNVYTHIPGYPLTTPGSVVDDFWVAYNISASNSNKITALFGSGTVQPLYLQIMEFSGLASANAFDVSSNISTRVQCVAPCTLNSAPSPTTTQVSDLLVAIFDVGGTSLLNSGNGWTPDADCFACQGWRSGVSGEVLIEHEFVSSVGSYTAPIRSFTSNWPAYDAYLFAFRKGP